MATGGGTSSLSAEMKAEIQEAVREAMAEVATAKAKAKRKPKGTPGEKDTTRAMGVDERDPRARPNTWPCMGEHAPGNHGNRFGVWTECVRCGLRLKYVPMKDAPAQTTHVDLPQNVVEALERLRAGGWTPETLEKKQVKSMIAIVAKEKAMLAPKAKASQAFGPPSRTRAKRAEAGPDLETLEDDEGFQHVDPLQEDGDEVQEVPPKPKTSPAKAAPAKPSVPPSPGQKQ